MAILDAFKKKKDKKQEPKELGDVKIKKKEAEKEEKLEKIKTIGGVKKKEFSELAARVLKSPHITEKAMSAEKENKYIFKVNPNANKSEIKKAVQELYGVKVENVNIINIPRKKRRVGRTEGFKPGYKKAVVEVREGEKIEMGI